MKHIDRQSRPPGSSPRLHRIDFEILRDLIHNNAGIYFQDNKRHVLQSRVMSRLKPLCFDYFEDYVDYALDPMNFNEVFRLVDAVTSLETSFFKSNEQFACIKDQILPSLINQKIEAGEQMLRIWSTACSTGEEVYSLAMVVHACLEQVDYPINVEIIGSDINTKALHTAEHGLYKSKSVAHIPPTLLETYLLRTPSGYQVHPTIMNMVTLKRINLADRTDMMRLHSVDMAFCANVLHSFSHEIKQRTLQAIYNTLNDDGYFMIGDSETLFGLSHPFLEINIDDVRVFQKCV